MRDPERLSSTSGLSDFERELLDAGKKESMPPAMREQMERALGLSGGVPAGAPARARVEAATGIKASAMVWISAGVVVLGVVGGIIGSFAGARLGSRRSSPRVAAPVTAVLPAATTAAGATPEPDVRPGADVSASPGARAPRAIGLVAPARSRAHGGASRAELARTAAARHGHGGAPAPPRSPATAAAPSSPAETVTPAASNAATNDSTPAVPLRAVAARDRASSRSDPSRDSELPAPPGDLRAEIDLIDGARAALRSGEPSQALDLLGRHAVHFPHGAFAPEETALRVEALMRLGRIAEARAYARRFMAANPASPLAERMRRLVNGPTAP